MSVENNMRKLMCPFLIPQRGNNKMILKYFRDKQKKEEKNVQVHVSVKNIKYLPNFRFSPE